MGPSCDASDKDRNLTGFNQTKWSVFCQTLNQPFYRGPFFQEEGQGPWHMRYKVVPQFRIAKLVNIILPWQVVRLPEGMEDFKDQK